MYKIAFVIVTLLLVILANSPQAQAANSLGDNATSKFSGKIVNNPDKANSIAVARGFSAQTYSSNSSPVGFYDVWFNMLEDSDGDGYYHQFEVNFDIDTVFSYQEIYVIGELAAASQQILFQTEPYTINSNSGNDSYQASVLLTDGYPSDQYELTLSVYDAETNALLLQYDAGHNSQLGQLYLEDNGRESVAQQGITLYQLSFEVSGDLDGDGYYTDLSVELDADAPGQQRWIYTRISLINPYGSWTTINTSATFALHGYDSSDRYTTHAVLDYGFDPATYQLGIEIYDAETEALLLTSTTPLSTPLNMESTDWDHNYEDGDYEVYVEEEYYASGSGGSAGVLMLLLLGGMQAVRRGLSVGK